MEHLKSLINHDGIPYYISTTKTPDHGLETMIFICRHKVKTIEELENDDVIWSDLYVERYSSFEDAERRHNEICNNIGKYLERK